MDAVVIIDPASISAGPANQQEPCASSHSASSQGLVTFLIYPPDDLVLVVKIQWIGD
jgi:hypothetical protein